MHKWGLVPSANCRCGAEEQTADHILAFCPLYLPSKWDTWFGGTWWWHCGLALNNRTLHLITRSAQTEKKNHVVYFFRAVTIIWLRILQILFEESRNKNYFTCMFSTFKAFIAKKM